MKAYKDHKTSARGKYNLISVVVLMGILISTTTYMIRTGQVNLVTGGIVFLSSLISGIIWADILNREEHV